jgi:anti-sigma factor RsiW
VSGWFSDKLGFPVSLPKYNIQGATFLGGRECLLGKEKAAYLFYEKRGKRVSLFIIHARDLGITLKGERVYNVSDKEHDVKVWREGDLVYALVK